MAEEPKANTPPENPAPPKAATPPVAKPASVPAETVKASAAPAAKSAAAAKPTGPTPLAWESPMVRDLRRRHGSGIAAAKTYVGQNYLVAEAVILTDLLLVLRGQYLFDYCVDITAVHYPRREKQFDLVWILYSFERNQRIRVKAAITDGEEVPTSTTIWATANWLEREVFDMFGIRFAGHPDLKRILLPDGWEGYPLRKDYPILRQDQKWVQINLGIESGQ